MHFRSLKKFTENNTSCSQMSSDSSSSSEDENNNVKEEGNSLENTVDSPIEPVAKLEVEDNNEKDENVINLQTEYTNPLVDNNNNKEEKEYKPPSKKKKKARPKKKRKKKKGPTPVKRRKKKKVTKDEMRRFDALYRTHLGKLETKQKNIEEFKKMKEREFNTTYKFSPPRYSTRDPDYIAPPKPTPEGKYKYFLAWEEHKNSNLDSLKKERLERIKKNETFKPQLSPKSIEMMKNKPNQVGKSRIIALSIPKSDLTEFQKDPDFKPQISPKTITLTKKYSRTPFEERLFSKTPTKKIRTKKGSPNDEEKRKKPKKVRISEQNENFYYQHVEKRCKCSKCAPEKLDRIKDVVHDTKNCTFKPQILKTSIEIVDKEENKNKRKPFYYIPEKHLPDKKNPLSKKVKGSKGFFNTLYQRGVEQKVRKKNEEEKNVRMKEINEMNQCSFSPKIKGLEGSKVYVKKKKKLKYKFDINKFSKPNVRGIGRVMEEKIMDGLISRPKYLKGRTGSPSKLSRSNSKGKRKKDQNNEVKEEEEKKEQTNSEISNNNNNNNIVKIVKKEEIKEEEKEEILEKEEIRKIDEELQNNKKILQIKEEELVKDEKKIMEEELEDFGDLEFDVDSALNDWDKLNSNTFGF